MGRGGGRRWCSFVCTCGDGGGGLLIMVNPRSSRQWSLSLYRSVTRAICRCMGGSPGKVIRDQKVSAIRHHPVYWSLIARRLVLVGVCSRRPRAVSRFKDPWPPRHFSMHDCLAAETHAVLGYFSNTCHANVRRALHVPPKAMNFLPSPAIKGSCQCMSHAVPAYAGEI